MDPAETFEREPNLMDAAYVLRRRIWLLVFCIALGLTVGGLPCLLIHKQYEAVGDLNMHPEASSAETLTDDIGSIDTVDWDSKVGTQIRILRSEALAWEVISSLRLDQEPGFIGHALPASQLLHAPSNLEALPPRQRIGMVRRFSKSLRVGVVPKTQIIEINFRSTDPVLAAKVVNALSAAYLHHLFITRFEATMNASGWLQDRITSLKANVEQSHRKLAAYQKDANIIGSDDTDNLAISDLSDADDQLSDLEIDRIIKEAKYRIAETGNPELIGNIVPDSKLPALRSQEADLKNQLAKAQAKFGAAYPAVIALREQLAVVQHSLDLEVRDIEERFRTEFVSAQDAEGHLKEETDSRRQNVYAYAGKFRQYEILKSEDQSGRQLYEGLLKKLNEAAVSSGLKATNVDILDRANVPVEPVWPKVPLFLVGGLFAGLFCGICGSFLLESMDHTVATIEDTERASLATTVGLIPHFRSQDMPAADKNTAIWVANPTSRFAESFRAFRSSILLSKAGAAPKILMITSAQPGDGKSTVSMNTAAVLAGSGAKVLLVDADLRRGELAKKLGVAPNEGLSGCLSGAGQWKKQIRAVAGFPSLWVLVAGTRPPNPADLLGSAQMRNMLREWQAEFDHVVIDTAPVVAVTDANVLAQNADGVIVVARALKTGRQSLGRAVDLLRRVRANIVGVVLNDFDVSAGYYGYAAAYESYYTSESGAAHD